MSAVTDAAIGGIRNLESNRAQIAGFTIEYHYRDEPESYVCGLPDVHRVINKRIVKDLLIGDAVEVMCLRSVRIRRGQQPYILLTDTDKLAQGPETVRLLLERLPSADETSQFWDQEQEPEGPAHVLSLPNYTLERLMKHYPCGFMIWHWRHDVPDNKPTLTKANDIAIGLLGIDVVDKGGTSIQDALVAFAASDVAKIAASIEQALIQGVSVVLESLTAMIDGSQSLLRISMFDVASHYVGMSIETETVPEPTNTPQESTVPSIPETPTAYRCVSSDPVDCQLAEEIKLLPVELQGVPMKRVGSRVYQIGRQRMACQSRGRLMFRVGGGWASLEEVARHHVQVIATSPAPSSVPGSTTECWRTVVIADRTGRRRSISAVDRAAFPVRPPRMPRPISRHA